MHGCRLRGRFEPEQLPRIGWRGDDVPKNFDDLSRLLDQRGIARRELALLQIDVVLETDADGFGSAVERRIT